MSFPAEPPSSPDGQWKPTWTFVPYGTHLSESRSTEGANRSLLRDDTTNRLRGPAESIPMEPSADSSGPAQHGDSPSATEILIAAAATAAVTTIVVTLVKRIDWNAVADGTRSRFKGATKSFRRSERRTRKGSHITSRTESEQPSEEDTSPEIAGPVITASRAQVKAMFESILAADAYASWQRENLARVQIDESEFSPELLAALNRTLQSGVGLLSSTETALIADFLSEDATSAHEILAIPSPGLDSDEIPTSDTRESRN